MKQNPLQALLICNGEMASPRILQALAWQVDTIVCADGGANAARAMDIIPDTIVGDFDSITIDTRVFFERAGVPLIHLERQDDTDFEKALIHLRERGVKQVVICGVTGKLLDHTLGNFSILLRYLDAFEMVLFDPHYRVDVITTDAEFSSRPGDRISVVPLTLASGVHYDGLRYPLQGDSLSFGIAEGTCNEALGDKFSISLKEGVLLVFRELHEGMWTL
ncbi:MAG: thiamine diphosphokinase [Bacteroidetes bacterium]|nr:thiamine diphosphokinase [Bacteroidota bacterium]